MYIFIVKFDPEAVDMTLSLPSEGTVMEYQSYKSNWLGAIESPRRPDAEELIARMFAAAGVLLFSVSANNEDGMSNTPQNSSVTDSGPKRRDFFIGTPFKIVASGPKNRL